MWPASAERRAPLINTIMNMNAVNLKWLSNPYNLILIKDNNTRLQYYYTCINESFARKKKKKKQSSFMVPWPSSQLSQVASSSVFLPGHGCAGGTPPGLPVLHCWWQHGSLLPHLAQLQPCEQLATDDPVAIHVQKKIPVNLKHGREVWQSGIKGLYKPFRVGSNHMYASISCLLHPYWLIKMAPANYIFISLYLWDDEGEETRGRAIHIMFKGKTDTLFTMYSLKNQITPFCSTALQ